jgi:Glycosyltransferases involved in cell wall biogenesis
MIPKISVLMPVYNGEKYLREAIESILNQTFTDFEFIIIDDASTDKSEEIIKSYTDPRIIYRKNEINAGLAVCLNLSIDMARGEYLARMDADDISAPSRLEEQLKFMEKNSEIDICGSWAALINQRGKIWKTQPDRLLAPALLFNTPLFHPAIIFRTTSLRRNNLKYNPSFRKIQDYELWLRAAKLLKLANIKKPLLRYRVTGEKINKCQSDPVCQGVIESVRKKAVLELIAQPEETELQIHNKISNGEKLNTDQIFLAEKWLLKIISANRKEKIYQKADLEECLRRTWLAICRQNGLKGFRTFISSELFGKNILEKLLNIILLAIEIKILKN